MPSNLRPFQPVKPGEILQEELEARGWTQADFAQIIGRPVQTINEIVAGKKAITAETAIALGEALGTTPEYWLKLDALYRLDLVHQKQPQPEETIARRSRLFTVAPVKELLKRRWLQVSDPRDLDQLERAVCDFLGVVSIGAEPKLAFAARRGVARTPGSTELRAWVCRVRHLAAQEKVARFRPAGLKERLAKLPHLSESEDGPARVRAQLAGLGIRFVTADHLPKTRVDGAAFWVDRDSPAVALSLRYDRIDWFWFTLMHELAHIALGQGRERTLIDDALVGRDAEPPDPADRGEASADALASEWLVPAQKLSSFVSSTKPFFYRQRILDFAKSIGVHPGIVVGRLQHEGLVPWTHFRNILGRVKPFLAATPGEAGHLEVGGR
jgi:HTH-type transcriptional regulator/antitoxin HigA